MSATAETIAKALGGQHGSGKQWYSRCPAHEDHNPSLSLTDRNGRVFVKCHAGCAQANVVAALQQRGLWQSNANKTEWREWRDGIRYPAAWGNVVCAYDYYDEGEVYQYSVVRFDPKDFRPGYWIEPGKWKWKKHPDQILYRMPEVFWAPIVFLVEGEKDVETLRDWGFTATTAPGGAKAPWLDSYTAALADKEVIVVPDNDEPGYKRAKAVCEKLLNRVAKLKVFELPEGCKDITNWFESGHSECELIATLEGSHAV